MQQGLAKIGVDLEATDFFVTHLHADHLGLVGALARQGARLFFSRTDANRLADPDLWERMFSYAESIGFPAGELRAAFANHPGYKYAGNALPDFSYLAEGDRLDYGGFRFRCLETPGHSGGHICLYEPVERLLISGDHILGDITPHIELWSDQGNSLKSYLESLGKVDALEVDLVLPGHRSLFSDCRGRIGEIREHHRQRAEEVLTVLKEGPQDGYGVARRMSWDLRYDDWDALPVSQRWFATGEALAHLKYVQEQGLVRRVQQQGRVHFALSASCLS
jgi:glyoxylase-like metal-dependent hydrolase (beta-lactamase superfamily II)